MRARHRLHLSTDGAAPRRYGHTCPTPETEGQIEDREGIQVVEGWILAAIHISSTTALHFSRSPTLAMSTPLNSRLHGRLSPAGERGYRWASVRSRVCQSCGHNHFQRRRPGRTARVYCGCGFFVGMICGY